MQARLTITTPHGETFEKLIGNTAIIGRGSSVHVRLSGDPQVSRYHALLRCHNGFQYQLIDLGSSNGTFAGQTRVLLPTSLSDEGYIHIGDHEIFLQAVHCASAETGKTMDPSAYLDVILLVIGVLDLEEWQQTLSESDFSQVLGNWHRNIFSHLSSYGARPDKFVRGNLVGYWSGEPLETMAAQALSTAQAVVAYGAKRHWINGSPLRISCALHTGRVALGMAGGDDPEEPLLGGAVNASVKLQEAAAKKEATIVLSDEVKALLDPADAQLLEPLGYAEIGGRAFSTGIHGLPVESKLVNRDTAA